MISISLLKKEEIFNILEYIYGKKSEVFLGTVRKFPNYSVSSSFLEGKKPDSLSSAVLFLTLLYFSNHWGLRSSSSFM